MSKMIIEELKPPSQYERILNYLKKTDNEYLPKTSLLVTSLYDYSKKIAEYANVYFIKIEDEDIGICAIYMNTEKAFITSIGIIEKYQNKGIATYLFNYVFKCVKDCGINIIELEVYKENRKAIKCYEKNGFKKNTEYEKRIRYEKIMN